MKMIVHFHANKAHFHKKGSALGLFLKVKVFGTQKWPISRGVMGAGGGGGVGKWQIEEDMQRTILCDKT